MLSPQNRQSHHWFRKFLTLAFLLLWVVGLPLAILHRQDITDWWRLKQYHAPALVANISAQDSMSSYGQRVFYVNEPEIATKAKFNQACKGLGTEQTIVLGCYHAGQNGIYIFDVSDQRLDGVEQVTAAHEMLHAGYERLSGDKRARVNKMLEDFYHNDLRDTRILKTINAYKQSEPKDVTNEMHSIFATEVRHLPAPLEKYYKKYFNDRSKVVTFAEKYQSEFTSRQDAIAAYDAQLSSLKTQIESLTADLKVRQADIAQQKKDLIELKSSGNVSAYNSGVPSYNSQLDAFNTEVARLNSMVDQYNQVVITRNNIALEEKQLAQSLNSQVETINQ